jgi:hypothetical protein
MILRTDIMLALRCRIYAAIQGATSKNGVKNKRICFSLLVVIAALCLCLHGSMVYAERISADEVEIITPVYTPKPENFKPRLGQYTYEVSWKGIPAGTLELQLAQKGPDYRIEASARTNRFIDFFYRLRYRTEALVSATTLYPKTSVYDNRQNKRRENTRIDFLPDGEIKSIHEDRRGNIHELRFKSNNFTLDPFSAVFLALSLEWDVGDTRQFDTFTGKSRYLVELTAIEKTTIRVTGAEREAIVISPRVKNLTKVDPSEDDGKIREARIYISTDTAREILKITGDAFIGTVNTDMVSFTPSKKEITQTSSLKNEPIPDWQCGVQQPLPSAFYP